MAHFADADPIKRLRKADRKMKRIMSGSPVRPAASSASAPLKETMRPRLVFPK